MKMEWRGIVEDMRNAAKFNRTPLNNLPDGFRVSGTILGEDVVTRESVAKMLEIWADFIEYECKKLERLLIAEQEENIDLRRALDPVMKCDAKNVSELFEITYITRHDMRIKQGQKGTYILHTKVAANKNIGDSQRNIDIPFLCNSGNAVREAQAIMKRGVKC